MQNHGSDLVFKMKGREKVNSLPEYVKFVILCTEITLASVVNVASTFWQQKLSFYFSKPLLSGLELPLQDTCLRLFFFYLRVTAKVQSYIV